MTSHRTWQWLRNVFWEGELFQEPWNITACYPAPLEIFQYDRTTSYFLCVHFLSALSFIFYLIFFSRYYPILPFPSQVTVYVLITFSVALTVWFFSLDAYSSYLLLHNKVPPNQAALKKEYQLLFTDKRSRRSASDTVSQGGGAKLFGQGCSHLKINCYKFCFHAYYSVGRPPVSTMQTSPQSYVNMADYNGWQPRYLR